MGRIIKQAPVPSSFLTDPETGIHLAVEHGNVPDGFDQGRLNVQQLVKAAVARMTAEERLALVGLSLDVVSGELLLERPDGTVLRLLPVGPVPASVLVVDGV